MEEEEANYRVRDYNNNPFYKDNIFKSFNHEPSWVSKSNVQLD